MPENIYDFEGGRDKKKDKKISQKKPPEPKVDVVGKILETSPIAKIKGMKAGAPFKEFLSKYGQGLSPQQIDRVRLWAHKYEEEAKKGFAKDRQSRRAFIASLFGAGVAGAIYAYIKSNYGEKDQAYFEILKYQKEWEGRIRQETEPINKYAKGLKISVLFTTEKKSITLDDRDFWVEGSENPESSLDNLKLLKEELKKYPPEFLAKNLEDTNFVLGGQIFTLNLSRMNNAESLPYIVYAQDTEGKSSKYSGEIYIAAQEIRPYEAASRMHMAILVKAKMKDAGYSGWSNTVLVSEEDMMSVSLGARFLANPQEAKKEIGWSKYGTKAIDFINEISLKYLKKGNK
jgi:hypothetical protein